jgi:hypothetical protein
MTKCNTEYISIGGYAYPKGCVPSKKIIQTGDIKYNGVELPCLHVQPCDSLNTILSKLNSILCTLTTTTTQYPA